MTYSCAFWDGVETLEAAQDRKLNFHIDQANAAGKERVLDIGCGWGSLMRKLTSLGTRSVEGLTLSPAQAAHIRQLGNPSISVSVEDWRNHSPAEPYDAVISLGAIEHFVRPEMSTGERVDVYKEFFSRCGEWIRGDGWMSLQTIAYGAGSFTHGAISSIFPESDLPRLNELVVGLNGEFELVSLRNDRHDYARTCRCWLDRLHMNRDQAIEAAGEDAVRRYESFLAASARGFDAGIFHLLRIQLRRIPPRVRRAE